MNRFTSAWLAPLQRRFDLHVGASPSFVIRRWRIIEAARRATERGDEWQGWASVAVQLGDADQAHLIGDFQRHLGVSPLGLRRLAFDEVRCASAVGRQD